MDIIVVEGTHDEIKVKAAFPNATCIITNGSEISDETIELIKEMSKKHRSWYKFWFKKIYYK